MKAYMIVLSHLSDVQEEVNFGYAKNGIVFHVNFVKYVIQECNGDLNQEIDPDAMWKTFCDKHGKNITVFDITN